MATIIKSIYGMKTLVLNLDTTAMLWLLDRSWLYQPLYNHCLQSLGLYCFRFNLTLTWWLTELSVCNQVVLVQGRLSGLLLFFHVIKTCQGICLMFVSSSILYCTGAFPCWCLCLVFSFSESGLYVLKTRSRITLFLLSKLWVCCWNSALDLILCQISLSYFLPSLDKNHSIDNDNLWRCWYRFIPLEAIISVYFMVSTCLQIFWGRVSVSISQYTAISIHLVQGHWPKECCW